MQFKYLVTFVLFAFIFSIKCQSNNEEEFIDFDFDDEQQVFKTNEKKVSTSLKQENMNQNDESTEIFDENEEDELQFDNKNNKKESPRQQPKHEESSKNTKKFDDEEFENLMDDDEFETSESTTSKASPPMKEQPKEPKARLDLKIADVPQHLMSAVNWQNFVWELTLLSIVLTYLLNYIIGRTRNSSIATTWFNTHQELLLKNFSLVGDDGTSSELPTETKMIKESDYLFGLWCSGRLTCTSLFVQLKLIKRQDLITQISKVFKSMHDQIYITVEFDKQDMDNYVFCLANKKISQSLLKEYSDLSNYCVEKKSAAEKYDIPSKYVLINELGETTQGVLDSKVCTFLNNNPDLVEYLMISDQYVGLKSRFQDEQTPSTSVSQDSPIEFGLPNARSMLVLCLNVPGKGSPTNEDIEKLVPAMQFALYLVDKVSRFRLSKESKQKALKKRKEMTEAYQKISNKQRQEAAQQRKEEKRRAEKDRIMNESDPEKQRKLEERDLKREKKKNLSRLKQVKIKSM